MDASACWLVYLVKCKDGSLYCGIAKNIKQRIAAHNNGHGAKYTKSRGPVRLVLARGWFSHSAAMRIEYLVKSSPKLQKIAVLKTFGADVCEVTK